MKVELNIPESLDDITLKQYQEYLESKQTPDDLLRIFLNLSEQGVLKIKDKEIDKLVSDVNSLFEQSQEHKLQFILKGVRMGFIPNLNEITYGENKDITDNIRDWKTMNKAMAVLYRPVKQKQGNKYIIEEYNGTAKYSEFMQDMPLSIVMGAMVFFYDLTNELLNCIPKFINRETKTQLMKGQISEENGEAIQKYTNLLKKELQELSELTSIYQ